MNNLELQTNTNDTIIEKGTTVNGSLEMSGSLNVSGSIIGDVKNQGVCMVTGSIEGKLDCFSLLLDETSYIKGDITTSFDVRMLSGVVDGNIEAKNAEIDGVVNGNVTTSGELKILSNAIINGDITTSTLQVEPGSKLNGFIQIKYQLRK